MSFSRLLALFANPIVFRHFSLVPNALVTPKTCNKITSRTKKMQISLLSFSGNRHSMPHLKYLLSIFRIVCVLILLLFIYHSFHQSSCRERMKTYIFYLCCCCDSFLRTHTNLHMPLLDCCFFSIFRNERSWKSSK